MAAPNENTAEDRTEPATPFRREEFRKRGQVAMSRELVSVVLMLALGGVLYLAMSMIFREFAKISEHFFNFSQMGNLDKTKMLTLGWEVVEAWLTMSAPIFGATIVVGVLICVIQVGFYVTWEPMSPNFDRLNPVEGFKRMFSAKSSMEAVKAFLKVLISMSVVLVFLGSQIDDAGTYFNGDVHQVFAAVMTTVAELFFLILAALSVVAGIDYAFQKYQHEKKMRMTKTEAKEEFKLREGDPLIRARIRSVQRRLASRRMMEAVPKADVVVTNPTHYAVALQYDKETMAAPKVMAKGVDHVALKIREVARFHHVPIVENRPLARSLHKKVDVGKYVPRDLFKAVAEVLAYVYRLRDTNKEENSARI